MNDGEITAMTPLFSIGVTSYDRVELLAETLTSILRQTFSDFEVIVANDNPNRILSAASLGISDPRIRFVNNPRNLGELGNMNSLLRLARGKYFTWIADDDLYAPNFLHAMHALLSKFGFPPCAYSSYLVDSTIPKELDNGNEALFEGSEFLRLYLAGELKAIGTMGMFDRQYLNRIGGLEDMAGGRIALYTEYFHIVRTGLLDRVAYTDARLVVYRTHKGSWGCSTADLDLFKEAGERLFRRSLEVLQEPQLVSNFDQNLEGLLKRIMNEFIQIAKATPAPVFGNRELFKYLVFSRRFVKSLKGSARYWQARKCIYRVSAAILWSVWRPRLISLAPSPLMRFAGFIRGRFSRSKLQSSRAEV